MVKMPFHYIKYLFIPQEANKVSGIDLLWTLITTVRQSTRTVKQPLEKLKTLLNCHLNLNRVRILSVGGNIFRQFRHSPAQSPSLNLIKSPKIAYFPDQWEVVETQIIAEVKSSAPLCLQQLTECYCQHACQLDDYREHLVGFPIPNRLQTSY